MMKTASIVPRQQASPAVENSIASGESLAGLGPATGSGTGRIGQVDASCQRGPHGGIAGSSGMDTMTMVEWLKKENGSDLFARRGDDWTRRKQPEIL